MRYLKQSIFMLLFTVVVFCGAAIAGLQLGPEAAMLGAAAFGVTRPFPACGLKIEYQPSIETLKIIHNFFEKAQVFSVKISILHIKTNHG